MAELIAVVFESELKAEDDMCCFRVTILRVGAQQSVRQSAGID